jgi:prophage regulatory protein
MSTTTIRPIPRMIRRHQLREMVPLADSTIYEMEQRGQFPRRFALSPRCVVWDLAEVEAWLALRRAVPVDRAAAPNVRLRRKRPVKVPAPSPQQ